MIDHTGVVVSDYARSKAFYIAALAPIGYSLLAARGARTLKGSRFVAWLERAFGAALVFFGIRLLMSQK